MLMPVAIGISRSNAAEITVTKDQAENKDPAAPDWAKHLFFVRLEGAIEKGDDEKFKSLVSRLPLLMAVVILNSPGGNLESALQIGKELNVRGYSTAVERGKVCASACALAWLAGDKRYMVEPTSRIGFHAASISGSDSITGEGNAMIGAYLDSLGIPMDAIRYITRPLPSDVQWLTIRDAMRLGINVAVPSELHK
jgi:hypothetical protein